MSADQVYQPLVELRHVSKSFHVPGSKEARQALIDVSFVIGDVPGRGQCRVLLGPSGCGKSTILNIVAGLIEPTEGEVLVEGRPVKGPGCDRGMVFQGYSSFPWLTVLDNVRFGLDLAGVPRKEGNAKARQLIERVDLTGTESLYPKNLSGGMRQRVAIARTLACSPKIILMDEPFGALDPKTRIEMQDLVASLWADAGMNTTVIFVTHDVQEAIFLADKIFVLCPSPGRIMAELDAPPAVEATRRGLARGEYASLENEIVRLIYGEAGTAGVQHQAHLAGG
jgi:ABC-type nitrate/sulfonate/bicarbonate transport system ATPase subunit